MTGRIFVILLSSALLLLAGCASKGYVEKRMAEMQAKVDSDVTTLKAQTDSNSEEIRKMEALTTFNRAVLLATQYLQAWEGTQSGTATGPGNTAQDGDQGSQGHNQKRASDLRRIHRQFS